MKFGHSARRLYSITFTLITILIGSTLFYLFDTTSYKMVSYPDELKEVILTDINPPHFEGDTLLISEVTAVCGTGGHSTLLSLDLTKNRSLDRLRTLLSSKSYFVTELDYDVDGTSTSNKAHLEVSIQQLSGRKVLVNEIYDSQNEYQTISKVFELNNSRWAKTADNARFYRAPK